MTLTSLTNAGATYGFTVGRQESFTHTTDSNSYVVIATLPTVNLIALWNNISVTTHDLLFKFEYTRDGSTWYAAIEDYPIAAGASARLSAVRSCMFYRVSVKPAVADTHGSCVWIFTASSLIAPPEYKGAFAYESITVTNAAAIGFTLATMSDGTRANITVEDNPIRIRWDGTSPTTSEGHLLQNGDTMVLDFTADMYHFRAIATGSNAKIRVTYSR
jgi:hypothetical protein